MRYHGEPIPHSACCGAPVDYGDICGSCRDHTGVMIECPACEGEGMVPLNGRSVECLPCKGWGEVAYPEGLVT